MRRAVSAVAILIVAVLVYALWSTTTAAPQSPAELGTSLPAGRPGTGDDPRSLAPCPGPSDRTDELTTDIRVSCIGRADDVVDLAAVLDDGPALVNLWASWCGPCREEMPVLDSYAAEPGAITVIGIDVEDTAEAATVLIDELGIRYPNVADAGDTRVALAAPPVLPLTYVLAADGTMRRVTDPTVFDTPTQVRAAVEELLS